MVPNCLMQDSEAWTKLHYHFYSLLLLLPIYWVSLTHMQVPYQCTILYGGQILTAVYHSSLYPL